MSPRPQSLAARYEKGKSGLRAFGLTELLVTLGLVAALCVLLVSVASRSRERAGGIHCLINLRQLYAAAALYAVEHHGYFPKAREINDEGGTHWYLTLRTAGYTDQIAYHARRRDQYMNFCPGSKVPANAHGNYTSNPGNYAINRAIAGYEDARTGGAGQNPEPTPRHRLRNPPEQVLLFDCGNSQASHKNLMAENPGVNYVPGHPKNATRSWEENLRRDAIEGRHGPTINLVHADGSAATLTPETFLNLPESAWAP